MSENDHANEQDIPSACLGFSSFGQRKSVDTGISGIRQKANDPNNKSLQLRGVHAPKMPEFKG